MAKKEMVERKRVSNIVKIDKDVVVLSYKGELQILRIELEGVSSNKIHNASKKLQEKVNNGEICLGYHFFSDSKRKSYWQVTDNITGRNTTLRSWYKEAVAPKVIMDRTIQTTV